MKAKREGIQDDSLDEWDGGQLRKLMDWFRSRVCYLYAFGKKEMVRKDCCGYNSNYGDGDGGGLYVRTRGMDLWQMNVRVHPFLKNMIATLKYELRYFFFAGVLYKENENLLNVFQPKL